MSLGIVGALIWYDSRTTLVVVHVLCPWDRNQDRRMAWDALFSEAG